MKESMDMVLALTRRYEDGYLDAKAITGFGAVIKTIAFLIAGAIAVGGLALKDGSIILASLISATAIGTLTYFLGVVIAAQGQILRATLDSAVNSSPFLQDEQKARVMRLSLAGEARSDNGTPREDEYQGAQEEPEQKRRYYQDGSVDTVLCPHCGTTVHHAAVTCRNCGGRL